MKRIDVQSRAMEDAAEYVRIAGQSYDDSDIDATALQLFAAFAAELSEQESDAAFTLYFRTLESETRSIMG